MFLLVLNMYHNEIVVFHWIKICNEIEIFLIYEICIEIADVLNMRIMIVLSVLKAMYVSYYRIVVDKLLFSTV